MNGNTSLYNPILSAAPGGNQTSDYTSTAPRASATSAGARNGEQKSPTLQNVNESNKLADSPNRVTLEGAFLLSSPSLHIEAVAVAMAGIIYRILMKRDRQQGNKTTQRF